MNIHDCKVSENFQNVQELWKQYFVSCNTVRFWNQHLKIFHHGSCSHVLGNKKVRKTVKGLNPGVTLCLSCSIVEETSPILREIISKTSNFKQHANFLVELEQLSRKFSRSTNAVSEISHVKDARVCYSWSLSSQVAG